MPVIVQPVSMQRQIVLRDLAEQRYSVAVSALAFASVRRHEALAGFTPRLAATQALLAWMPASAPLGDSLLAAADGYGTLANALEVAAAGDQLRAAKSLYDPSLLGDIALASYGVSDPTKFPWLTPGAFATIMAAGAIDQASRNSQQMTIGLCQATLAARHHYVPTVSDDADVIVDSLIYARLAEYVAHFSDASQATDFSSMLTADRKEHILRRVATLRAIARELAAIAIGPVAVYTDHLSRILAHPWVARATYGRTADEVARAVKQLATGKAAQAVRPPWPEFALSDCFDPRLLGWAAIVEDVPSPVASVALGTDRTVHPLAADLSYPVDIKALDVDRWLNLIWMGVTRVERALQLTAGPETGQAPGFPAPTFNAAPPLGTPTMLPDHGYPVMPAGVATVAWPDDRVTPGTLGLSAWTPVTLQGIKNAIRAHAPRAVVYVRGTEEPRSFVGLPTLIPAAGIVAKAIAYHPVNTDTLPLMWGMAAIEWQDMLRATGGNASALPMRAVADALRFIGIVVVHSSTGRGAGIVAPFDRMYYHASSINQTALADELILAQFQAQGGDVRIGLKPFRAIPTSARLDELAANIAFEETADARPVRPYAKWRTDQAPSGEPGLEIVGIVGPDPSITDIVTLPTLYEGTLVTLIGDEAKAMGRREDNAVWSLTHEDSMPEYDALTMPAVRTLLER